MDISVFAAALILKFKISNVKGIADKKIQIPKFSNPYTNIINGGKNICIIDDEIFNDICEVKFLNILLNWTLEKFNNKNLNIFINCLNYFCINNITITKHVNIYWI